MGLSQVALRARLAFAPLSHWGEGVVAEAPMEPAGRALNGGCQQRIDLARNRKISKQSHLTTTTVIWEPVRRERPARPTPKAPQAPCAFASRLLPAEICLFGILCLH